jgi:F0F1-type ATP synthase assembly protein I
MKNQIFRTLILQYFLGGIYLLGTALWDKTVLFSALVGCMAALIPNTYFSIRMAQTSENNNAVQWLGYAYRSEIAKWLMMGMIFILAFNTDNNWDPGYLFAGFVLVLMSGWFAAIVIKGN